MNDSRSPDSRTRSGAPGATASREKSPELALSWWKRGHEASAHSPAFVRYTNTDPDRVTTAATFRDDEPNVPTAGLATIQSEVSLGHPPASPPDDVNAW